MPERSANISTHDPFGSLLGYAPGGIAIYSSDYHTADEKEYPDDAAFRSYLGREYMGYKWQCVEFACMPAVPATQEAEAGELPKSRRQRLQ